MATRHGVCWLPSMVAWLMASAVMASPPTKITVYPEERVLVTNNRQQLAVRAYFPDGTTKDITRLARYDSTNSRIAGVDQNGRVSTFQNNGAAWIIVHYRGCHARFRAMVPRKKSVPAFTFPEQTLVDRYTQDQWKRLGFVPLVMCRDEVFLRRVTLHLTGLVPSLRQLQAFAKDDNPRKRAAWVDKLLASPEHHTHFANLWADALRVPHVTDFRQANNALPFYQWIRKSVADDKSWTRFAEELLRATGNVEQTPAGWWYVHVREPRQRAADVARMFFGARMECVRCHEHPHDTVSTRAPLGLAALFGRVQVRQAGRNSWTVSNRWQGVYNHPATKLPVRPCFLDGTPLHFGPQEDPRTFLLEDMLDKNEPKFARVVVNRVWANFFGRGLVHPIEEMTFCNPSSNPELLEALMQDFLKHHASVKHLLRTICNSRTYQLSATPTMWNADDDRYFSRRYPQPMSPPVMHDVLCQLSKMPPVVNHLPKGKAALLRYALFRAEPYRSRLFHAFPEAHVETQCLRHTAIRDSGPYVEELLAEPALRGKFTKKGGWVDQLVKDRRPDAEKINDIFLWILGRRPTPPQLTGVLQFVQQHGNNKKAALEQVISALITTQEFLLIQ